MSKNTRRFKQYKNKTIKGGVKLWPWTSKKAQNIQGINNSSGKQIETVTTPPVQVPNTPEVSDQNQVPNTPDMVSEPENALDKTGAAIINNVNEVLESDIAKETTKQAAKDTVYIVKELAGTFNKALDDPEFKAEAKQAIQNVGELGLVFAEAAKEPVNIALNNTAESIERTMPKLGAAGVKILWDTMGAIPPISILVDGINIVNDVTKATSAASKVATEAIESASDAFSETKKKFELKLKELEEKKRISQQISNRTTNSIKEFEDPIQAGGYKTRRRLFKHKAKSKRVRFTV